jgi:ABC-2 type transport system permease protein
MGLLLPVVVALVIALAQLLPLPVAVRLALPTYTFISWEGLFTSPAQTGPLLISIVVSLVWAVVATALAYVLFLRRDFTNVAYAGSARRTITVGALPLAGLVVVAFVVIAVVTPSLGSGITKDKLQDSLATVFAHLYRLQAEELNRPAVTEEQLAATAQCTKGDDLVEQEGAGNDWRCVVTWRLPGVETTGQAIYQLDATPDGRYMSDGDGPKDVNGYYQVRTPAGDQPNPLWQFDGNVELLSTTKG